MRWSLMIKATGSSRVLSWANVSSAAGATGGAHDSVGFAVFAAEILDDGLKDAYVIVNRQQDRSRHKKSVVPEGPNLVNGLPGPA